MPSALVIGAGPAGAATALLLARAGWQLTIVERHAFPRDKVCGECLSHLGYQVLTRLGIGREFHDASPVALTQTDLYSPEGTRATLPLPDPMWGLSRYCFDLLLVTAALRAGATLLQPSRCEHVSPGQATLRDLRTNTITRHTADHIVLADGRRSLAHRPPPTGDLGIKAHFEDVDSPPNAISLFSLPGHYLGVAPIESPLFNVACSVPAALVRSRGGDLDALFEQFLTRNVALARTFRGARRVGDWLASPLPRFGVSDDFPPGIVPVGNAAASLEPIGGEGMGLALRSAELAAGALALAGRDPRHPALRDLVSQYRRLWLTRRAACRAGAIVLSHSQLSPLAVDLLNTVPEVARGPLYLIGK